MTIAEKAVDELAQWYSEGVLSWATFLACMENTLKAEADGWGREQVPDTPTRR